MSDQKSKQEEEKARGDEERRRKREEDESEEEKTREGVERGEKSSEREEIPLIKLKNSDIFAKEKQIDTSLPEINEQERELKAPEINLRESSIKLKETTPDKSLPEVKKEKRDLNIPLTKLNPSPTVRAKIEKFDKELAEIGGKSRQRKVKVPIFRKGRERRVRTKHATLSAAVDDEIEKLLLENKSEAKPEEEMEEKTESREKLEAKEVLSAETGGGIEDIEDILFEKKAPLGSGALKSRGPKIIFLLDRFGYSETIRTICEKICREMIREGKLEHKVEDLNESYKDDIEATRREIEKWLKVGRRVFRITFEDEVSLDWGYIKDRIDELKGQDTGFLVFVFHDEELWRSYADKFKYLLKFSTYTPDMIRLESRELSLAQRKKLAGLIHNYEVSERGDELSFDRILKLCKKKQKKARLNIGGKFLGATDRNEGEESDLHFDMKAFIVRILAKKLKQEGRLPNIRTEGEIDEKILTEEEWRGEGKKPDVQVSGSDLVYEVETLYGEGGKGGRPLKKIDETISKYEEMETPPKKINIVMDGLTMLLHLRELATRKRRKKVDLSNTNIDEIEFYTLDWKNEELVPISKVIKTSKELKSYR